jgi:hypothetical protein
VTSLLLLLAQPTKLPSIFHFLPNNSEPNPHEIATWAINVVLSLILCIYIIIIIVKFAKFKLTSAEFQIQSIAAVIIGLIELVVFLTGKEFFNGALMAAEVSTSIGICIYVIVIRRRGKSGVLVKMQRPGTGNVEPEIRREEVQTVGTKAPEDLTVVAPAQATTSPSLNSARTAGEVNSPQRKV